MNVVLKLFASLRSYGPDYQQMEVPEDTRLEEVIARLDLPEKMPLLKIVNGKFADPKQPLNEGDEIALFPPIAGGSPPCGGNR
ncbi:MAG: MoaD/ThiS family protein [Nitrospirota bacterium]